MAAPIPDVAPIKRTRLYWKGIFDIDCLVLEWFQLEKVVEFESSEYDEHGQLVWENYHLYLI